jgi:DNA-directed RNA polymerase subunit RPC12/RpoP
LVREKLPYGAWKSNRAIDTYYKAFVRPDMARVARSPWYLSPDQITEKLDGCERCGGDPLNHLPAQSIYRCPECGPLRRLLEPDPLTNPTCKICKLPLSEHDRKEDGIYCRDTGEPADIDLENG